MNYHYLRMIDMRNSQIESFNNVEVPLTLWYDRTCIITRLHFENSWKQPDK